MRKIVWIIAAFLVMILLSKNLIAGDSQDLNSNSDIWFSLAHQAAPWSEVPNTENWTNTALSVIRSRLADFEKASDVNSFCSGYFQASPSQREICWLRIVGGMVRFESSYRSDAMFREPNGVWSVGLLALSAKECPNAPSIKELKDPIQNLVCGLNMMANFIARAGYISGPKFRGAATYWSVLRPPYRFRRMRLGKKPHIIAISNLYKNFE